jgi:hypothetical protein
MPIPGASAATISNSYKMDCDAISFSRHAILRMFARAISPDEVRTALVTGEVIADSPEDTPYPSVLILAISRGAAAACRNGARRQHRALLRDNSVCTRSRPMGK